MNRDPHADHQHIDFLVVGMARSGTTVVQRLLSELDSVWVPRETHFWRHALALATRFPFPLDRSAAQQGLEWFLSLESSKDLELGADDVVARLPNESYLWDLFQGLVAALSPPEARHLGEKTPDHARWAIQLLGALPELSIIGLVRDPREVYRSHLSVPWGIRDPWAFAEKWVSHSRILSDLEHLYPDRASVIRYEDLVEGGAESIRELAGDLLGLDGLPERTAQIESSEALFSSGEWWKESSLEPVRKLSSTWSEKVDREAVEVIEWRAQDEMKRWGYAPADRIVSAPTAPKEPSWVEIRSRSHASEASLPITRDQLDAWLKTDHWRAQAWRRRSEELLAEKDELERHVETMARTRESLEEWRKQAQTLATLSADLNRRNEELSNQLKSALARANDFEESTASWRSRAEYLNAEEKRLRARVREEMILRLELQKKERRAAGNLRRLRSRRWWKLAGVLSRWRRAPWRVDRLVRELWQLAFTSEPLPAMPDTSKLETRIARLREELELSRTEDDATVVSARNALDAGDYEQSLDLLDSLPAGVKESKDVQLIYRDLYIRLGEVSKALASVRLALSSQEDQQLRRQARILEGRLRETETHWLPSVDLKSMEKTSGTKSILHILKESLPYFERGYTIRSHMTLMAQTRAGFDPTVVTSLGFPRNQGFKGFPMVEVIDGVTHHRLDLGPSYETREIPYDQILSDQATLTAQLARGIEPSVIQAGSGYRGYETALVGLAVARYLDVPMIYEIRSFLEHTWTPEFERSEQGEYYQRRHDQETRCLLDADQVITIAEAMRDEIIGRGVPAEKVAVVPNVVDIERFKPRPKSEALVERIGLGRRPVLGYVSNLGAREGIDNLVRSVRLLRDAGLDVAGLVVGDGPEKESLEDLISSLGLEDDFSLTGHVPNEKIEDHYALIDLFVIPRIDDRAARLVTPLKPLEAMAMGIPVIASDLPALRELALPGERGEVFAPGDPEALAQVAGDLLESPERRSDLAASARDWVMQERTLESNAHRYEQILNQVLLSGTHAR